MRQKNIFADVIMRETNLHEDSAAGKACIGRVIAMATEEMTKQPDVIPDVQKPCSAILVSLGNKWEINIFPLNYIRSTKL